MSQSGRERPRPLRPSVGHSLRERANRFDDRCCFCLGGVISGVVVLNESFALGRSYGHALLLVSACLLWASAWHIHNPKDYRYIFIASLACGIQNGLTTRFSGNVVRTTHMTGTLLSGGQGALSWNQVYCSTEADRANLI